MNNIVDRITIIWIILMFISAFLGIFFDEIYGQKVIEIVIGLISLYFMYVFCEVTRRCIRNKNAFNETIKEDNNEK
jgi:uncharacterized membrane protein YfcA